MAWAFHQEGIGAPFDYCFFGRIFEARKSCEIQTIYAIMREIRAVTGYGTIQQTLIGRSQPQDVVVLLISFDGILALNSV